MQLVLLVRFIYMNNKVLVVMWWITNAWIDKREIIDFKGILLFRYSYQCIAKICILIPYSIMHKITHIFPYKFFCKGNLYSYTSYISIGNTTFGFQSLNLA